jgi:hypothetical protein
MNNIATTKLNHYKEEQRQEYGFCADPDLPTWNNLLNYVQQLTTEQLNFRPTNMSCHNYCEDVPPPPGTRALLSLGLKYCVRYPRPTNNINSSLNRLENDVRRIFTFLNKQEEDNNYIPQLYIRSDHIFKPLKDDGKEIEDALTLFRSTISAEQRRYRRPRSSNLHPLQWRLIKCLKSNNYFIVIEADKNLGACILPLDVYTKRAITEHLGDTSVYKRLSKEEARELMEYTLQRYRVWINKYPYCLSKAEVTFLERGLYKHYDKFARFRMSLKAHKDPWKMRPIVCCAGTTLNCLSRWLDYHFQRLKPFIPSYIKDGEALLNDLDNLGQLPTNARLFTTDANSMYTNINTTHAIAVISEWLDNLPLDEEHGLADFPLEAV